MAEGPRFTYATAALTIASDHLSQVKPYFDDQDVVEAALAVVEGAEGFGNEEEARVYLYAVSAYLAYGPHDQGFAYWQEHVYPTFA